MKAGFRNIALRNSNDSDGEGFVPLPNLPFVEKRMWMSKP